MGASDATSLIDVAMPQMGVSVAQGTVLEWRVSVGDEVAADDVLCEISTDKIDTELPAPVTGVLAEICVGAGETVDVGVLLARIRSDEPAPVAPEAVAAGREGAEPGPASGRPAPPEAPPSSGGEDDDRRYSPVVRRIAETHGVDLGLVEGSGRAGRVTKRDVLAHVERRGADAPRATADDVPGAVQAGFDPTPATLESGPLSRMRLAIGRRMTESKSTAAHCNTWIEVDMSGVERRRRELGITALPLIAVATTEALRSHPPVNAWIEGETRTLHRDVNLGIAVSLGEDGLIVPVIHDAQELSAGAIAERIGDLAAKARSGDLSPDEVAQGTFTITNPGRHGTLLGAPIINQPQVAILDVQGIAKRPVVVTDAAGRDSIGIRPTAILGLAWDHRAIDGDLAAEFLATLRDNLERVRITPESVS